MLAFIGKLQYILSFFDDMFKLILIHRWHYVYE